MDFEEYTRRILGEGSEIDLSIDVQEPDEEAVLLVVNRTPYISILKRLKNELINTDILENTESIDMRYVKPIYLKIADQDALAIGKIDLTIKKVHYLQGILFQYEPRFYRVEQGRIGNEIVKEDLVKTIKLTGGKSIHEYI